MLKKWSKTEVTFFKNNGLVLVTIKNTKKQVLKKKKQKLL